MSYLSIAGVDAVIPALRAASKKQAIEDLAARAAGATGLDARIIFNALLMREQLGSTGVGRGIAIPHGKIAGIDSLVGFFARLVSPVDYDAPDGRPVDLMFLLLAPEQSGAEHLKALARVARVLRDPDLAEQLRSLAEPEAIYALLCEDPATREMPATAFGPMDRAG